MSYRTQLLTQAARYMAPEGAPTGAPSAVEAAKPEAAPLDAKDNIQVTVESNPEEGKPFAVVGDKEFATQEDLSKWYDEQRAQGKDGTEEAPAGETQGAVRSLEEIKASLKEAGGIYADPRYEAAAIEFEQNNGVVSPEMITKTAAEFGVPEDFVKEFINNAKLARDNQGGAQSAADMAFETDITSVTGGRANYDKFVAWGKENLTPLERAAYDKALGVGPDGKPIGTPDAATAKALLEGYYAKYKASGDGPAPRDVTTEGVDTVARQGVEGYASEEEMTADMRDPKYAKDPAFRAKVAARVQASQF